MMNVLAICLLLTTLVTAGAWSPSPPSPLKQTSSSNDDDDDVIVRNGHRTVLVEFEKEDGNTKVSISPQDSHQGHHQHNNKNPSEIDDHNGGFVVEKEIKNGDNYDHGQRATARELVCDAFGKCKHRIASALGRTGEMVSEKARDVADKVYEIEEGVKEAVEEGVKERVDKAEGKAKEAVEEAADMAKRGARRAKEAVEEGARETVEKAKSGAGKAKEVVEELARETAEKAKHGAGKAREGVQESAREAADKAKHGVGKARETVQESAREAAEKAKHGADKSREAVQESAGEAAEMAKHGVGKAKEAVEERRTDAAEKAKGGAEAVIDKTKSVKEDIERKASEKMAKAKETAEHAPNKVKHGGHKMAEEGKKGMKGVFCRSLQVLYSVFKYALSPESFHSFMRILHLLGFATAYGMSVWVTFLSSNVLAMALPRQQFAMVQSKLYPVYFKAMAGSVAMALLGYLLSQGKRLWISSAEMLYGVNLLSSLLMILMNLFYLEPWGSKVRNFRVDFAAIW